MAGLEEAKEKAAKERVAAEAAGLVARAGVEIGVLPADGRNLPAQVPPMVRAILFGGDRLACCERFLVARKDGKEVGALSLSSKGEGGDGRPEAVGVWVDPAHRKAGIAVALLAEAVRVSGATKISKPLIYVAVTEGGYRVWRSLPLTLRKRTRLVGVPLPVVL